MGRFFVGPKKFGEMTQLAGAYLGGSCSLVRLLIAVASCPRPINDGATSSALGNNVMCRSNWQLLRMELVSGNVMWWYLATVHQKSCYINIIYKWIFVIYCTMCNNLKLSFWDFGRVATLCNRQKLLAGRLSQVACFGLESLADKIGASAAIVEAQSSLPPLLPLFASFVAISFHFRSK